MVVGSGSGPYCLRVFKKGSFVIVRDGEIGWINNNKGKAGEGWLSFQFIICQDVLKK